MGRNSPTTALVVMLALVVVSVICVHVVSSLSGCSVGVVYTNTWPGGLQGQLSVQADEELQVWTLDVFYSDNLNSFDFFTASYVALRHNKVMVRNKSWNGNLAAGAVLQLGWMVGFDASKPPPTIEKVIMNGRQCSLEAPKTTTENTVTVTTTRTTTANIQTTTKSADTTTTTTQSSTCDGITKYNYDEVITLSNLFYQAQRSGKLDTFGDYNHARIPYRGDSALHDGYDNGVDLSGGYYDAGDFVKFNFPMAAATTLLAWGAVDFRSGYRAAGQEEETLNTIKWATDYFIKCHPSANVLYAQVGDGNADHSQWNRVEDMTIPRPSFKIDTSNPGSDLAGETAAALAAASIAFNEKDSDYSKVLLLHAKQLFTFAMNAKGKYSDSVPAASAFYKSWSGYEDELVWAAVWLYKATKDKSYLKKARSLYVDKDVHGFSWDDKTIAATILLAQITRESKYIDRTALFCNKMADTQPKTGKGMVWIQKWGPLRHASNVAFACLQAAKINHPKIDAKKYRKFALSQIHYALGDTGRSYVIGFGNNPPKRPHHRSSSCPTDLHQACNWDAFNNPGPNPNTLWGALVGGPGRNDDYEDSRGDYIKNEVACDYNAGFQSAVAGLRSLAVEGKLPGAEGISC